MVAQQPVELILLRQLASYLTTPIFVVDHAGALVYYNEAAELLLGRAFADTDEMPTEAWLTEFVPHDLDGTPLDESTTPVLAALLQRREQHRSLAIRSADGREHRIEATAIPLVGQDERLLGAVAIFWPSDPS